MKSLLTRRTGVVVGIAIAFVFVAASCHLQRAGQDVRFETSSGGTVVDWMTVQEDDNYPVKNPSFPVDGINHIYTDANNNCGGSWGTVGSGHTSPPDSTKVNCFMAEVNDDAGDYDNQSLVCDDAGTANDCESTDGDSNTYVTHNLATAYYRYGVAGTYARAERTLEWARDWQSIQVTDTPITDYPDCLVINHNFTSGAALPSAHVICPT